MMKRVSLLLVFAALWSLSCCLAAAQEAVPVGIDPSKLPEPAPVRDIGSRRELFLDKFLIERLDNASLKLHEPAKAPRPRSPLIGGYATVIKDGELFRAVYRSYNPTYKGEQYDGNPGEMTCYAESRDGHEWTQPNLGIVEINGNRENNVILRASPFSTNFSPFLDDRPDVPADQRFKATAGLSDHAVKHAQNTKPGEAAGIKGGLYTFASPDCIHWRQLSQEPAITMTEFSFDSQNVSFWSPVENQFVCNFRSWQNGLRSISRATSPDFMTWSKPAALSPNLPGEHLYTSQTHPYFRAPHIYVALPTRFHPGRGESTDILLMTARGDAPYDRTFREAFIRPGLDPAPGAIAPITPRSTLCPQVRPRCRFITTAVVTALCCEPTGSRRCTRARMLGKWSRSR